MATTARMIFTAITGKRSLHQRVMDEVEQLPESLEQLLCLRVVKESLHQRKELKILVAGKIATGKSTLVEALIGECRRVDTRVTKTVQVYVREIIGIVIKVYDTPPLHDSSQLLDMAHIENMQRSCDGCDLFLFCISMLETRLRRNSPDVIIMESLSKIPRLWERTVIVLTFANALPILQCAENPEEKHDLFTREYECWKTVIKDILIKDVGLPSSTAKKIPIIPAGHYRAPHLPGQMYWLTALWLHCFIKLEEMSAAVMPVANVYHK